MSYLFDASAIVNLVKNGMTVKLYNGVTLDLAVYESLNAVWKEHRLLHRIDHDVAIKFADSLINSLSALRRVNILDAAHEVFELAILEGLTIYDAAYVKYAQLNNLTLVTDDSKLLNKATKYVRVIRSYDIK